jgi:hypothetical protein
MHEYLTADIQVHADFIERNHDLDYFACFSNTQLTKYKKWEVKSPRQSFKIWFTNMDGERIEVKTKAEEELKKWNKEKQKHYEEDMKQAGLGSSVVEEPDSETEDSEEPDETQSMYISSFVLEMMLIY